MPTDTFIPLAAEPMTSSENRDFHVLVLDQPKGVRHVGGTEEQHSSSAAKPCEPEVSLLRDKGVITGVHIRCSCGKEIDLLCSYEETFRAESQ